MKFFLNILVLVSLTISLSVSLSNKIKNKRDETMMEYMNSFFTDDNNKEKYDNIIKQDKNAKRFNFKQDQVTQPQIQPQVQPQTTNINSTVAACETQKSSPNTILSAWFMISSSTLHNVNKYPPVILPDGRKVFITFDSDDFRLNPTITNPNASCAPYQNSFYFRVSGLNIYYTTSKDDMNVLGAIQIKSIISLQIDSNTYVKNIKSCFQVTDKEDIKWKICGDDTKTVNDWIAQIKNLLGDCSDKNLGNVSNSTIEYRNITQPIIIIPLPSRSCNENWNYKNLGNDWECDCAEGKSQSPIDLPNFNVAVDSPVKPFFEYNQINSVNYLTTATGQNKLTERLLISLENNIFKIRNNNFGRVVTVDGAVYKAEEISIKVPSEHTIEGKKYDMELQILHRGISKGDLSKNVLLVFLFKKAPGIYNKFIDDLDTFNLPNPTDNVKEIVNSLYIPKLFYNADSSEIPSMKPFSFYTYQGSIPNPPCTEDTIVYVVSKPIPLSTVSIELFQEALRTPDLIQGNTINMEMETPTVSRKTQPLNGRPVFYYDSIKYCGPEPQDEKPRDVGHYEKITKTVQNYFYVNNDKPSGLPSALVVSREEATGGRR